MPLLPLTLLLAIAIFGGIGFAWGYWAGRRRGRREAQQGFPVLPVASKDPQ